RTLGLLRLAARQHLENMKAVAALNNVADLACLKVLGSLYEQIGPAVYRPHAQLSATERLRPIGRGGRHTAEISTASDLRQQAFRFLAQSLDLGRTGALGHHHQNLGQTENLRTSRP